MFYESHLTKLVKRIIITKGNELFHHYILVYDLTIANVKCYFKQDF